MKLRVEGRLVEVELLPDGAEVRVDGQLVRVACARAPDGGLRVEGRPAWVAGDRVGQGLLSARVERVGRAAEARGGSLTPPIPATVLRVLVAVGERVDAGQVLVVLGAMKTEIPLRAPEAGVVVALHARVGDAVLPADRLVEVEAAPPLG